MIDYDCTRRGFLRRVGLGAAALLTGASSGSARSASTGKRLNILPFTKKRCGQDLGRHLRSLATASMHSYLQHSF